MSFVERRTVARFTTISAGGQFQTHDVDVPPGDRDPEVPILGGPEPGVVGVTFFDHVVAEVDDPITGEPIICCSTPLNPMPGIFYYRGLPAARKDIESGIVVFPVLVQQSVLSQMSEKGWTHIIYFDGGKYYREYRPRFDLTVAAPKPVQEASGLPEDGIFGPQTKATWMALVETVGAGNPLGQ